jgi:hypothetical protein
MGVRIEVCVDGHVFNSIKEMANHLNVRYMTLFDYRRKHDDMSWEDIYWLYKEKTKPIVVDNHVFNSKKDLAEYLGIKVNTLHNYVSKKDNDCIAAYYHFKNGVKIGRPSGYIIDGIEFSNIQDIADYLNVKHDTFMSYKTRTKCTAEEVYYHFKKKLNK